MRSVALLLCFAAACGAEQEPEEASATERGDVDALLEAFNADETLAVLEEADRFVADDLPARAGEMLESAALPAMRRQRERVSALSVHTDLGRRMKATALERLRAREESTTTYARVLARGLVEDLAFVEASAAQRQAEAALLDLGDELQAIRHPEAAAEEAPRPEPGGGLEEFDEPRERPR